MPSRTAPPLTASHAQGGVLPISAVTQKGSSHGRENPRNSDKASNHRLKVIVRRLPPRLTEIEFYTALGSEWMPGNGKVTWASFRKGKVSKEPAKPSRPARAYLHITEQGQLDALSRRIAQTPIGDDRASPNGNPALGSSSLEFAPYSRIPGGKRRYDARQGTIDQDPEFIEFLESLTNPITKPNTLDATESHVEQQRNVTPLIQYLRDKKVAKEKAASMKAAAKHQKQDIKAESNANTKQPKATNSTKESQTMKRSGASAKMGEPSAKDALRSPPTKDRLGTPPHVQDISPAGDKVVARTNTNSRRPEISASGSTAVKMIQRDLGLKGGRGTPTRVPRADRQTIEARKTAPEAPVKSDALQNIATVSTNSKAATQTPAGPTNLTPKAPRSALARGEAAVSQSSASGKQSSSSKKSSVLPPKTGSATPMENTQITDTNLKATRAFLKHANPSQGITETLLGAALTPFGKLTRVGIDKRKGFAYVDFADPSGLQAAMAASPIAVAQGSVQVLEHKDRGNIVATAPPPGKVAPVRGGRGGSGAAFRGNLRGNRGRGAASGGRGNTADGTGVTIDRNGGPIVTTPVKPAPAASLDKSKTAENA